jgi:hypothetical protein
MTAARRPATLPNDCAKLKLALRRQTPPLNKKMNLLKTTWCVVLSLSASAFAEVINVRFTDANYTGVGLVGPGTNWNNFPLSSGSSKSSLLDSRGAVTPVSIQVSYGAKFTGTTSSPFPSAILLGSGVYGPFSFTLTGLSPGARYTVFTFHHDKAGLATTTQLTGALTTSLTPTNTIQGVELLEGGNFLRFAAVSPSADGILTCSSTVAWGGLNAVQIVRLSRTVSPVLDVRITPATTTSGPGFSGNLSGGPEAGRAIIQASTDLGTDAVWRTVFSGIRLDDSGTANLTGIRDNGLGGLVPKAHFFRAVTTP